jgi:outer membrane protein OmpA-like peptidoglycan-associated protein
MMQRYGISALMLLAVFFSPATAQLDKGKITLGLFGSGVKLVGDTVDHSNISPAGGITFGYTISPLLTLTLNGGYGWVRPMDLTKEGFSKHFSTGSTGYKTVLIPLLADLKLNLNPSSKYNPYLTVGGGILLWDVLSGETSVNGQQNSGMIDCGLGLEWFLSETFGIDVSAHYQFLAGQDQDMSGLGDVQTGGVEARLGLNLYLGGRRDSDGDGIRDKIDNCPDQAEDLDNFHDEDGCPDVDTDRDGIVNRLDRCRRAPEDKDGFKDEDGCPDPDNDKDGIHDTLDQCRDVAGIAENNGCPDVDSDNDGIVDRLDKCPKNPGVAETEGCPQTKEITREGLVLKGVNFRVGKADILESSWPVLDQVVTSLKEWPEVNVEIQGHTDITGSAETNRFLSQQRAEAVKQYLVDRGISASRLTAVGYGPDVPVGDNKTAAGRAMNRRVELKRSN